MDRRFAMVSRTIKHLKSILNLILRIVQRNHSDLMRFLLQANYLKAGHHRLSAHEACNIIGRFIPLERDEHNLIWTNFREYSTNYRYYN